MKLGHVDGHISVESVMMCSWIESPSDTQVFDILSIHCFLLVMVTDQIYSDTCVEEGKSSTIQ